VDRSESEDGYPIRYFNIRIWLAEQRCPRRKTRRYDGIGRGSGLLGRFRWLPVCHVLGLVVLIDLEGCRYPELDLYTLKVAGRPVMDMYDQGRVC
jgi:hypothetical protein